MNGSHELQKMLALLPKYLLDECMHASASFLEILSSENVQTIFVTSKSSLQWVVRSVCLSECRVWHVGRAVIVNLKTEQILR